MPKKSNIAKKYSHEIRLSGLLIFETCGIHRKMFLEALRDHQAIGLDCSKATEVDLGFVQLVLSAKETAETAGKTLSLMHPADGPLLGTLQRAGFVDLSEGATATDQQTFWLAQSEHGDQKMRAVR